MVHACCAYNCKERFKKGGLSFYRFPTNKELHKKWTLALRRKNFNPSHSTRICEKHFQEDCFQPVRWNSGKRKKLKENAVPTIFDFPPGYIKIKKARKAPKDRSNNFNLEEEQVLINSKLTEKVAEKIHESNDSNLGARASNEPVILVEKVDEKVCGSKKINLEPPSSNESAGILVVAENNCGLNSLNLGAQTSNEPVILSEKDSEKAQTSNEPAIMFVEKVVHDRKVCGSNIVNLKVQISNEAVRIVEKVVGSYNSILEEALMSTRPILIEKDSSILRIPIITKKIAEEIRGSNNFDLKAQISNEAVILVEKVNCGSKNSNLEEAQIPKRPIITEKVPPSSPISVPIITEKVAEKNTSNLQAAPGHICPACETLGPTAEALNKTQSKLKNSRRKLKTLQQKCRRQKFKLNKFKALIQHWQRTNSVDEEISDLLQNYIPQGGEIVLKINVPKS